MYERHAPGAVRLAYLMTGDRQVAEDIAQDAFVKVAGRFHDLRSQDAFGPYFRRAVVNLCNSHFRRQTVERAFLRKEATAPPPASTPPDVERRDSLRVALLALPPRQRAAIVLRYFEDMSEAQTGELMGCSAGAVKSLVARGMQTLRIEIEGEDV